ncbi:MAG: ADP-ribosylation factor-like protein, partial [Planctomycetota bacterium]
KSLRVGDREMTLLIWDLHGEDEFQKVKSSYLRGSSGYFIVVDGTRKDTVRGAIELHDWASSIVGELPCTVLLNKVDLEGDWIVDDEDLARLEERGLAHRSTSAKTGAGVEEAFAELSARML